MQYYSVVGIIEKAADMTLVTWMQMY